MGLPLTPLVVAAFRYPYGHERLPFASGLTFHLGQDNSFLHVTHLPALLWSSIRGIAVFLGDIHPTKAQARVGFVKKT